MIDNLQYNTERSKLIIPEYGRHLHKMIDQALACENRDERSNIAKAIIGVMGNMNPHLSETYMILNTNFGIIYLLCLNSNLMQNLLTRNHL